MGAIESFLQTLTVGLGLGAIYALIAIGFTLIFKVTGVLNFAQGYIAVLGAFTVVILSSRGVPPYWAVAGALVFGLALGYLLEVLIFQHFIGEPTLSVIIVTLALGEIIGGSIQIISGPGYQSYPDVLTPDWTLSLPYSVDVAAPFAIAIVLSLAAMLVMMLFFQRTVLGSILQASASDQQAAIMLGISIRRTIVIAWTLSIAITVLGGMLLAVSRGGASLGIESVVIIIFAAVVFGGIDSIPGAFLGAIIVGVLEQVGTFYLNPMIAPGFGRVLPMLFLLSVLIIMPHGLFGTERIERL